MKNDFKQHLIDTFNKLNDKNDSFISEDKFLDINLNVFEHFNNKVPIVLDADLNCEHLITVEVNKMDINYVIENAIINHIEQELIEKPHSKIIVCMFLYSVIINEDKTISIKGNFKIKK